MTGSDGLTTFDEFKALVKGLKSAYTSPSFLPDAASVKVWYMMLRDLPYDVLSAGIYHYILMNKFPPTIADLRELCTADPNALGWDEAWEQVQRVIGRYGYYRESEALAELDETTRQCVNRLGFKNLCVSENMVADRANFRTIYEAAHKKHRETAAAAIAQKNVMKIEKNY